MTHYCPRCEQAVEILPEHLTPTIPPMIPAMPEEIWLREVVGHRCAPEDVQAILAADLAKIASRA